MRITRYSLSVRLTHGARSWGFLAMVAVFTGWADTPSPEHAAPSLQTPTHWAFQPIRRSAIPAVKNRRWIQTPLDAFVLAKLEEKHLSPAPAADRRTLLRRATYDLVGLPPTPDEIDAFVADD